MTVQQEFNKTIDMLTKHLGGLQEEGIKEVALEHELIVTQTVAPKPPTTSSNPTIRQESNTMDTLEAIAKTISTCTKCPLHTTRNKTVPGAGNAHPDIMFIGEGPGTEEDKQGIPFVGKAGQLLTRMIERMGYTRDEVFIGNIVKCRPTVNFEMKKDRPPTLEEMAGCIPYLKAQIDILKPKVIIALGNVATEGLFGVRGITKLRGQWRQYEGIDTMLTYHPSFLLRGGGENKGRFWEVWDDLVAVLEKLGRPVPEKK